MDSIDLRILGVIQADATLSLAAIADRVGLSQTPCWKRIRRLEQDGVITGRVALLNPRKVGVPVTVFASIRTNRHDPTWLAAFADAVTQLPEVVEVYRMSGQVDYLLKIVCPDIAGYDAVYRQLIEIVDIHDVSSAFAMEELKATTALPLRHAPTV